MNHSTTTRPEPPTAAYLLAEIKTLIARNAAISKAGGFFTPDQIENERRAHGMKQILRFTYGIYATGF